jgi:butyryl-CoA dehydrogenase
MAAARALPNATGEDDARFYRGKLQAARYYFGWELPRTRAQSELLERLDATPYEMAAEWF